MKKHLLILLSVFALLLAGCKSKKEITPTEETKWQNVTMPVTLTIQEPMSLTLNGTLTMVRGEYALISFRTFGFEVAKACVTPENMDLVLKMPQKLWISEPLGNRLASRNIDFTKLQDEILANGVQTLKVSGLTVSSHNGETTLTLSTTAKGMKLGVAVTYNLDNSTWNSSNPQKFSAPGSEYKKLSISSAANILGK